MTQFSKFSLALIMQAKRHATPSKALTLVRHYGGVALLPLAVVDSSIIPTFGSLDLLTGWLAVSDPELWWYYALMSTAGSLIGAFITYRMGRKVGEWWIEGKIGRKRTQQVRNAIENHGSASIFVSTIAPPPFPTPWFFAAAGAFSFSLKKFLLVTFLGRALRYSLLTLVAAHFGRTFLRYLRHPLHYLLISVIVTASLITAVILFGKWKPAQEPHASAGA
ncbi:MAG TPA: VTT domain-containing protein [Candidatus Angelobacter sp.]